MSNPFRVLRDYPMVLIGLCILLLGFFSVYTSFQLRQITTNQQHCLEAFVEQKSDRDQLRAQLAEDVDKNNQFIIETVIENVGHPEVQKQAFDTWLRETNRIRAMRAKYPPIQFDRAACDAILKKAGYKKSSSSPID